MKIENLGKQCNNTETSLSTDLDSSINFLISAFLDAFYSKITFSHSNEKKKNPLLHKKKKEFSIPAIKSWYSPVIGALAK